MHPYFHQLFMYRPRKLTWNRKMMVVSRNLLFQGFIFRWTMSVFGGIYYIHDGFNYPDGFKIHYNIYIYVYSHKKHDGFIYPDFGGVSWRCVNFLWIFVGNFPPNWNSELDPLLEVQLSGRTKTPRSRNWRIKTPATFFSSCTRNPPTTNPARSHYSLVDWNDEMIHEKTRSYG